MIFKSANTQKREYYEREYREKTVADSIIHFFFANEEFFRFLQVRLRFCYIQKKIIDSKMT